MFTKYDYLVVEPFQACNPKLSLPVRKTEAIYRAETTFNHFTKGLEVRFAPVSSLREAQEEYGGLLIRSVTSLFSLKSVLYCRSDARKFDQGDADSLGRYSTT